MEIATLTTHAQALKFRALRNELIASNIANADTPNYKARDIDFASALRGAKSESLLLMKTNEMHASAWSSDRLGADLKYRNPTQPSLDGNTVDVDVEEAEFAKNAVHYRVSLAFIDSQIRTTRLALKGTD